MPVCYGQATTESSKSGGIRGGKDPVEVQLLVGEIHIDDAEEAF